MRPASAEPSTPKARIGKRSLWERVDRRVIRSATYASLVVVLIVLFGTTQWFIEHYLSGTTNQSIIAGLAIALGLAIVFQVFHQRIEHAIEQWLNRGASVRLEGLKALAQEITLIHDPAGLQRRVVERLEWLLATSGAAI